MATSYSIIVFLLSLSFFYYFGGDGFIAYFSLEISQNCRGFQREDIRALDWIIFAHIDITELYHCVSRGTSKASFDIDTFQRYEHLLWRIRIRVVKLG